MLLEGKVIDCGERDTSIGGIAIDRKRLKTQIYELSQVNNLKAAWALAFQWLIISAAIAFALGTLHYFTGQFNLLKGLSDLPVRQIFAVIFAYTVAASIVATRQNALAVLMHDAAHYRLFSDRTANDIISDIGCAFPLSLATSRYRRNHIDHHRFLNSDKDPDWVYMNSREDWRWPKTQWEAIKLFMSDLLGLKTLNWLEALSPWSPWLKFFKFEKSLETITNRERILLLGFWGFVATGLTLTHSWLHFLLLWFLPQFTFLSLFVRVRTIAEHLAIENKDELNQSRDIHVNLFEKFFIAPLNVNYHLTHHMFPSVPYYNLPKLHELLMQDENFKKKAKVLPSYLNVKNGVLSEMFKAI